MVIASTYLLMIGNFFSTGALAKDVFRAGAFAADITPKHLPVSVNGGFQDRMVGSVHDRLHARCLVLDDGKTRLALVVCDSCLITRESFDAAKRLASQATGIPEDKMLMAATHTHSAPTAMVMAESRPDPGYLKYLETQIAEGIRRAVDNLASAKIGWGVGLEPAHVFNRRWKLKPGVEVLDPFGIPGRVSTNPGFLNPDISEPAGPVDPEISILSVQSPEGRPIALLANYSLHYVGGMPPLSADYFGQFATRIEQLLGAAAVEPPFVGIMSNGTSGDVNNINYGAPAPGRKEPFEQVWHVADRVARAVLVAHKRIEHHDWVSLAMVEREIELGVRRPEPQEVIRAKEILAKAKGPALRSQPVSYARETLVLSEFPPRVKVKLQAIRIGDLGIASAPCEVFAETGLALKKGSALQPAFTIGLANGYNGYLPTPEQHRLGGYETWRARWSYLEVDASTKLLNTLLDLMNQVRP